MSDRHSTIIDGFIQELHEKVAMAVEQLASNLHTRIEEIRSELHEELNMISGKSKERGK